MSEIPLEIRLKSRYRPSYVLATLSDDEINAVVDRMLATGNEAAHRSYAMELHGEFSWAHDRTARKSIAAGLVRLRAFIEKGEEAVST